jgi:hypothetical protein
MHHDGLRVDPAKAEAILTKDGVRFVDAVRDAPPGGGTVRALLGKPRLGAQSGNPTRAR